MRPKRGQPAPRGATPVQPPAEAARTRRPPAATRARKGSAHARRRGAHLPSVGAARMPAARRIAAGAAAALLAAGLAFLVMGPWLRIGSVGWAGARYVSARSLAAILDPLKGTSLLALDGPAVAQQLASLPGVASASVEPRFPDGVLVVLVEETPAIVWQTGPARLLLGPDGMVLAEVSRRKPLPADLARLPFVDDQRVASYRLSPGAIVPDAERTLALRLRGLDPQLLGSSASSLKVAISDRCGFLVGSPSGSWWAALGYHVLAATAAPGGDQPSLDAQVAAVRTLFAAHPESTVAWVDARNPGKVYWRPSGSGSGRC